MTATASEGSVFVTGTDTEVGKTFVSCVLLRALAAGGRRVVGMKPVAAGAVRLPDGRLDNDDVRALAAASSLTVAPALRNPYCFEPAVAPHIAAAEAGVRIDLARIVSAFGQLAAQADAVVVEGVGGFRVPLGHGEDTAGLAVALGLPVVLVVGLRLGCLNHAMLSAEAIAARGLRLIGWIGNAIDPAMARPAENLVALTEGLPAPCLGVLPHAPGVSPERLVDHLTLDVMR